MNCLASTLGGGVCAPASDGFGFASFHLQAFEKMSTATFELALLLLTVLMFLGVIRLGQRRETDLSGADRVRVAESESNPEKNYCLRHWLALLEKRDPALSF